ncbi:caspase domain-containing protein [Xylaria telfairii]|nr:caspase domain-containing protein [Xylaria telfairii]
MESGTPIYDISKTCDHLFTCILSKQDAASVLVTKGLHHTFEEWASYLGVFAPENVSLDTRLKYSEPINKMVLQYLQVAFRNLDRISKLDEVLKAENAAVKDFQRIILKKVEHAPESGLSSPLVESLRTLKTAIDGLHRLGIALRQSSLGTLHQKISSFAQGNQDAAIENMVFLRLKYKFFDNYEEKSNCKSALSLYRQLAISISFRYFGLLYRERRQKTLEKNRRTALAHPQTEKEALNPKPEEKSVPRKPGESDREKGGPNEPRRVAIANAREQRKLQKSEDAPTTVITENVLQKFAAPTSGFSVCIKDAEYPEPPSVDLHTRKTKCPFCWVPLSEVDLNKKGWWRHHLHRDLSLYPCLSEMCAEPPQLFVRFDEWRQHMDEQHSSNWVKKIHKPLGWCCDVDHDDQYFDDEEEYDQHFKESHLEYESERTELKEWSKIQRERPPYTCPICNCIPKELSAIIPGLREEDLVNPTDMEPEVSIGAQHEEYAQETLLSHIGTHLRQLGLMSVTYFRDDDADSGSRNSERGTVLADNDGKLPHVENPPNYFDRDFKGYMVPTGPELLEVGVEWSYVKDLGNGKRYQALLIGIDRYNSSEVPDLSGCLGDVNRMESYLRNTVGIVDIFRLTSPRLSHLPVSSDPLPTRDNVVWALEKVAARAQKDDFVYIHFSGHGIQLPTNSQQLNCNDEDGCLALVREDLSGDNGQVDYLRAVELVYLLKKIVEKGAAVTIVLDCCHLGDPCRGISLAGSAVRRGSAIPPLLTSSPGFEFLSACRADQKSQELRFDDLMYRGLLTECLLDVLQEYRTHLKSLTCDMVFNLVSSRVVNHPKLTRSQDVVFGGERHRVLFGTGRIAPNKITVSDILMEKLQIKLSAGKAHGVAEEDVYAVYPPGRILTSLMDYNSPPAICKIFHVEDFTSTGFVKSETGVSGVKVDWEAIRHSKILRKNVLVPRPAKLLFPDEGDTHGYKSMTVLEKLLHGCDLVKVDNSMPFFTVSLEGPDRFKIAFTPLKEETVDVQSGEPVDVKSEETLDVQSDATVLSHLKHLSIYYNILDLAARYRHNNSLSVEIFGYLSQGVEPPAPYRYSPDVLLPVAVKSLKRTDPQDIQNECSIGIRVRNMSQKTMFIEILDLDPYWEATRVYPMKGNMPIEVPRGEATDFFLTMTMPDSTEDNIQPSKSKLDSIIVLANSNRQENFPIEILPTLGKEPTRHGPLLEEAGSPRGAKGVDVQWYAQRVDVRVVRTMN